MGVFGQFDFEDKFTRNADRKLLRFNPDLKPDIAYLVEVDLCMGSARQEQDEADDREDANVFRFIQIYH